MLEIGKSVHRYATGIATALSIAIAVIAAVDPSAFGVDVEIKVSVIGALNAIAAAVNVLRARTDPITAPPIA